MYPKKSSDIYIFLYDVVLNWSKTISNSNKIWSSIAFGPYESENFRVLASYEECFIF
jgi:hypothetical protein